MQVVTDAEDAVERLGRALFSCLCLPFPAVSPFSSPRVAGAAPCNLMAPYVLYVLVEATPFARTRSPHPSFVSGGRV